MVAVPIPAVKAGSSSRPALIVYFTVTPSPLRENFADVMPPCAPVRSVNENWRPLPDRLKLPAGMVAS